MVVVARAVELVEDLLAAERSAEAGAQLAALTGADDLAARDPALDATVEYLRLSIARVRGGHVDRFIIGLRALATRDLPPALRVRVRAQLAQSFARKRCRSLARAELAQIAEIAPRDAARSRRAAAAGHVELAFDRRAEAIACWERAAAGDEPWLGHSGLAHAYLVVGDHGAALRHAHAAEAHPRGAVAGLRARAQLARIRGDWAEVVRACDALLAAPGDHARDDRGDRASALYALGERDAARAEWRALAAERTDDAAGAFAAGVLAQLECGGSGGCDSGRVMLPAFPTVRQKRDACGAASLELVLRALGVDPEDAAQDAIAADLDSPDVNIDVNGDDNSVDITHEIAPRGTSLWAMTRYLERRGFHAVRFEAAGARLDACLARGVPVIVEHALPSSLHVAVAIGVDRALGAIYLQDPASCVPRELLLADHDARAALCRHGALVALPAGDPRIAELAATGITDAAHLRLVDEVERPALRADPSRAHAQLSRAIAACPDYPLAWAKRLRAAWAAAHATGAGPAAFLAELRAARTRYPDLAFPHQVHADWLVAAERFDEALIELDAGLRVDPADANAAQDVAECYQRLGRDTDAEAAFWRALALDPAHVRAAENFAALALARGDYALAAHFSACALDVAPHNPFNRVVQARIAQAQAEASGASSAANGATTGATTGAVRLSRTGP